MDSGFLDKLSVNFDNFEKVAIELRSWLSNKALIKASRFLRSKLSLIPLLDYLTFGSVILNQE